MKLHGVVRYRVSDASEVEQLAYMTFEVKIEIRNETPVCVVVIRL